MKCFYRKHFRRKLINHEEYLQISHSNYNIKDAIYNIACAWDSVKCETLRRTFIPADM